MEIQEVILRKLTADTGKILVSKEKQKDEDGNETEQPLVKSKEIYLGKADSEDNYIEVDDNNIESEE